MADALILGGGVAKGAYIAGALRVLMEDPTVNVRRIVATSSGALCGAFLASAIHQGTHRTAMADLETLWLEHGTFRDAFDVNLRGLASLEGVSSNAALLALLREHVRPSKGTGEIDLRLVLTATAGRLDARDGSPATTFEQVLAFNGNAFEGGAQLEFLFHAVTASAAFPLAFLPVSLAVEGKLAAFLDGGLVNSTPIKHALGDPSITRIFVITPFPSVVETRPRDAHGLGLMAHLADVLVNERLYRDVKEARAVNRALDRLATRVPGDARARVLDALGWSGRRPVEIIEIRPYPAALEGGAFDGFFSLRLREAYVAAGRAAATATAGRIAA